MDSLRAVSAGGPDPSITLEENGAWLATHTPEGPATLHVAGGTTITVEAWGPGAESALERAPGICGATDDPTEFVPEHPMVRRMLRRFPGVRITHTGAVVESLLRMVVGQRVTGTEARTGYTRMAHALGGAAPGPRALTLPPDPARVAASGYPAFHHWGIERGRAETLIRVATRSKRLEEAVAMPLPDAYTRITAIRGVGPWTAAKVGMVALGDPDAVPIGDYHLPNAVAFGLAGEARGDDAATAAHTSARRPGRRGGAGAPGPGGDGSPRGPTREFRGA